jgi:uncharacterized damage-inducible protein DinB
MAPDSIEVQPNKRKSTANIATGQLKWAELEQDQVEFLSRATNELLENMLPFRATRIRLRLLLQHVANHSTYHRGQVALMMRQLGAESPATDFHEFLVEALREPSWFSRNGPQHGASNPHERDAPHS